MNDLFSAFNSGSVANLTTDIPSDNTLWNQHPTFSGVSLKHLVTGAETDGKFSAHLVRLEPGAEIGNHVHATNWELHEVADGSGHCVLDGRNISYAPGVLAVLPENVPHRVCAGKNGLCLLAKFIPALL